MVIHSIYLQPIRRIVFLIWAIAIGTRDSFGFIQLFRFLPRAGSLAVEKWLASVFECWQGWRTWKKSLSKASASAGNAYDVLRTEYFSSGGTK